MSTFSYLNKSMATSLFGYLNLKQADQLSDSSSPENKPEEEELDSFNYENALPHSLLHSPPEYNNISFSSFESKRNLELVSTRLKGI